MKVLEDLSYVYGKVVKVGGVSEVELVRLEISFCFFMGFELVVIYELLSKYWEMFRRGIDCWNLYDELMEEDMMVL